MDWNKFLNLTKEFINSKKPQEFANIFLIAFAPEEKTRLLQELKNIILNLDTLTKDESVKYFDVVANTAETIGVFNETYESLLMNYSSNKRNLMEFNFQRDLPEIQIVIKNFLESSLTFLMNMDKVQNITADEKNTFKKTGIVLAFYNVFIRPPLDFSGGRKRISKSFQNSRIRRRSHRRRRTVKSHRRVKSRRRRSVKRRRL